MAKQEQNLGIRFTGLVEHIEANGYLQSETATREQLRQAVGIAEGLRRDPRRNQEINMVVWALKNNGRHREVASQARRILTKGVVIEVLRTSRIQKRRGITKGARTLMEVGR